MALSKSILKTSLTTMFTVAPNPVTIQQHCIDFAELYDDYAKGVIDSVAGNGLVTTGKSAFQTSLEVYLTLPVPVLSGYASSIESACISYWTASVFNLTNIPIGWGGLTSIEITPMTSTSISTDLTTVLESTDGEPNKLAEDISDIIHSATSSVSLLLSGVSPLGSPLSLPAILS